MNKKRCIRFGFLILLIGFICILIMRKESSIPYDDSNSGEHAVSVVYQLDAEQIRAIGAEGATAGEKNRLILLAAGYTEDELDAIGQDALGCLIGNASELVVSRAFYRTDSGGRVTAISQDEFDAANPASDGTFSSTMLASRQSPTAEDGEDGWYILSGQFYFPAAPDSRMTDALSLCVRGDFAWSQDRQDYALSLRYLLPNGTYGELQQDAQDYCLGPEGVAFTQTLPRAKDMENLTLCIRSCARISYFTREQTFSLHTQYVHAYSAIGVQPDFTWVTDYGLCAELCALNGANTYPASCTLTYVPYPAE